MYLSPRMALSSSARTLRAGFGRPGGEVGMAAPVGCSSAATVPWRTPNGAGITPGTGEPVGSIVGVVCMCDLPERGSPIAAPTARYRGEFGEHRAMICQTAAELAPIIGTRRACWALVAAPGNGLSLI